MLTFSFCSFLALFYLRLLRLCRSRPRVGRKEAPYLRHHWYLPLVALLDPCHHFRFLRLFRTALDVSR